MYSEYATQPSQKRSYLIINDAVNNVRTVGQTEDNRMINLSTIIRSFDLRHVGTCPTCMRISFGSMITAWAVLLVGYSLSSSVFLSVTVAAIILTILWFAHIFAFSKRYVFSKKEYNPKRRNLLKIFIKASIAGAALSWSTAAFACTELGGECTKKSDCCSEAIGCAWVTGCSLGKKCCY